MARTETTVSRERITVVRRYPWPEKMINWWTIIMLATGGLITGVFGDFMSIQNRMGLGTPWLFPYGVTVGSLTLFFIIVMIALLAQNKLQPAMVLLGSFILIALFLAGLIETAIQLFGNGNVSSYCNRYVNNNDIRGVSIDTLAWLEQNSICSQWDAVFAFWIIGIVFLVWMMIIASQIQTLNSKKTKVTKHWAYWHPKPQTCNCRTPDCGVCNEEMFVRVEDGGKGLGVREGERGGQRERKDKEREKERKEKEKEKAWWWRA